VEYCRSFRHFTAEVLENLFHFEGKFLVSMAWLIAKPGRLTKEFVAGRRQSQLNPLRFYIFGTVLFFLVFHLVNHGHLIDFNRREVDALGKNLDAKSGEWVAGHRLSHEQKAELTRRLDAVRATDAIVDLSTLNRLIAEVKRDVPDAPAAPNAHAAASVGGAKITIKPMTTESAWIAKVGNSLLEKIRSGELRVSDIYDELEHRIPTMLFLGMPLFALVLKLRFLSTGRFYLEHLIFSLHLHTWFFIVIVVAKGYIGLGGLFGSGLANAIEWAVTGWMLWYLVASFRTVYGQRWLGSTFTALGVGFVYTFALFLIAIALFSATVIWIALE